MLNKKNEEEWVDYLEANGMGMIQMTDKFFAYKQNIVTLRETLQRHFNTCMNSIKNGLPEVLEDDDDLDTLDVQMNGRWTCRVCQVRNEEKTVKCLTCQSDRPKINSVKVIRGNKQDAKPGLLGKIKNILTKK